MLQTHQVTILGRVLPVKTTAPATKVKEIESFVNSLINEIKTKLTSADPQLVVILALLNLAEQHLEQRANGVRTPSDDVKAKKMLDRLNKALGADSLFGET